MRFWWAFDGVPKSLRIASRAVIQTMIVFSEICTTLTLIQANLNTFTKDERNMGDPSLCLYHGPGGTL